MRINTLYEQLRYIPCFNKSHYEKEEVQLYADAYIDLEKTPIIAGGKII